MSNSVEITRASNGFIFETWGEYGKMELYTDKVALLKRLERWVDGDMNPLDGDLITKGDETKTRKQWEQGQPNPEWLVPRIPAEPDA